MPIISSSSLEKFVFVILKVGLDGTWSVIEGAKAATHDMIMVIKTLGRIDTGTV